MRDENELREEFEKTIECDRYAVFMFRFAPDHSGDPKPIKISSKMHDWPTAEFPTIMRNQRELFAKELKRLGQDDDESG